MTEIPTSVEAKHASDPDYGGFTMDETRLQNKRHRKRMGGHRAEIGKLQIDFLVAHGLKPTDRFLDVGCGSFRAGRHLVDYLQPGGYHGIDINHDLISTGYNHELTPEQRERLPIENLRVTDRFEADFGQPFDMAIAQSGFTHIPMNFIRLCLHRVSRVLRPGGVLFATFTEAPPNAALDAILRNTHYRECNPYWYYRQDMRWAAVHSPLSFSYIGDWVTHAASGWWPTPA